MHQTHNSIRIEMEYIFYLQLFWELQKKTLQLKAWRKHYSTERVYGTRNTKAPGSCIPAIKPNPLLADSTNAPKRFVKRHLLSILGAINSAKQMTV